jgi:hypothetical protein
MRQKTFSMKVKKLSKRDRRVDEILKDGPGYVERARERARAEIEREMRERSQQTRHRVA